MRDKFGRFIKGIPSWNKGIPHSEEAKRKNRLAHLGKQGYWKGKKLSKKHIEKMRIARKGEHTSPATEFKKGHIPWIKGKKGWIKKSPKAYKFPKGKKHPLYKGRIKDSHGYIFILKPNHPFCDNKNYVREHRLVVEKKIKRFLKPTEKCHHLNKIRNDNRPENLMAFISENAHQRFHKNPASVKPSEIIFDGRHI